MKKIFFGVTFLLFSLVAIFVACENSVEEDFLPDSIYELELDLQGFFRSNEFKDVSESFGVNANDFTLDQRTVKHYSKKNITQYCIPIQKNGNVMGQVWVFSKNDGEIYRVLFEDRSAFSESDGGIIRILTGDRKFVASLDCKIVENNKLSIRIADVGQISTMTKASVEEWPTPDDGWLDCTTRCYQLAREACGSDAQCNLLCDLADLAAGCTITVAAACAIYCA